MNLQAHAYKLRSGRQSQSGQIFILTTVTQNRVPVFNDFPNARKLISVLRDQQRLEHAKTLAFW
jgi:hypothetical protein